MGRRLRATRRCAVSASRLIDRGDFAGATSSHSSKLIHGGLRYLPQGQIRLVYHALRERERLRRVTAPHLVSPIRFLFPFYAGRLPSGLAVRAGLMLYDLFARTPSAERHQRLRREAVHAMEPGLARQGLRGGAVYFDGFGDDARLTLENLVDTAIHGGAVMNYAEAVSFEHEHGRIVAASFATSKPVSIILYVRDASSMRRGRGWIAFARSDDPSARPAIRLTKGVHLVISAARLR